MIMSNVEFKDLEEQSIARDNRVSCNQIRTKQSSFKWLKERWRRFRVERLSKKLEGMKDDLVTSSFNAASSGLTKSSENRLTRKTNAIAKVEEKIKILSKETVPSTYVKHRAIKLREKMMKYMVYNSSNAYSVGIENYDNIFGEDAPVTNPINDAAMASVNPVINVEQISAEQQNDLASEVDKAMTSPVEPVDRKTIQAAVEDSFANLDVPQTPVVSPVIEEKEEAPVTPVDRETIQAAVEDTFANMDTPQVPVVEEKPVEKEQPVVSPAPEIGSPIDRSTIENVVNQSFAPVEKPEEQKRVVIIPAEEPVKAPEVQSGDQKRVVIIPAEEPVKAPEVQPEDQKKVVIIPAEEPVSQPPVISPEEVEKVVGDARPDSPIDFSALKDAMDSAISGVKIKNVSSDNDFIEEMKRRKEKYNYVSMTDEEIAQARENIEYDKYEKVYADQWNAVKNDDTKKRVVIIPAEESVKAPEVQPEDEKKVVIIPAEEKPDEKKRVVIIPAEETVQTEEKPVREPVVIVPERESDTLEDKKENIEVASSNEEDIHFDYSSATESEVASASDYETSRTGLEALKARVLKIKEEHKKSEIELTAARDEQTDEARKALEIREASRARKHDYEESVKKLQDYCDSLEEQTKVNRSSAAISRNDTECNRRFIEMHTAEMHDYEDKIREIDSIMSQDTDEAKRR